MRCPHAGTTTCRPPLKTKFLGLMWSNRRIFRHNYRRPAKFKTWQRNNLNCLRMHCASRMKYSLEIISYSRTTMSWWQKMRHLLIWIKIWYCNKLSKPRWTAGRKAFNVNRHGANLWMHLNRRSDTVACPSRHCKIALLHNSICFCSVVKRQMQVLLVGTKGYNYIATKSTTTRL